MINELFQSISTSDWISFAVTALSVVFHIITIILCYKGYHVFCMHDGNNNQKEVSQDMKPRMSDYRENLTREQKLDEGQTFSRYVKQFVLNERTNELEEVEPLDIVQLVNSNVESCFQSALQRLLPTPSEEADSVVDLSQVSDDLDFLSEAMETAEMWRDRLNLSQDISVQDIFAKVEQYEANLLKKQKEVEDGKISPKDESIETPPSDDETRKS